MTKKKDKPHHHGDLRNALINAAIDILNADGTNGLTLRKAAARAGVSHAAPAHHFGNLEGLLAAVASRGFGEFTQAMERGAADAGTSPKDQVLGICRGYLAFARAHPALLDVMFRAEWREPDDHALGQQSSTSYSVLQRVAAPFAATPAEARIVEAQIWSLIHGYTLLSLNGRLACGPDDPSANADAIMALLDHLPLRAPSPSASDPLEGSRQIGDPYAHSHAKPENS